MQIDEKKQVNDEVMDEFFDTVNLPDAPAMDLTTKMKEFVLEHEAALGEMYKVLGDEVGAAWDAEHDPISLDVSPIDQESIHAMVSKYDSNPQFNKIVIVFAHLCKEIRKLVELGEKRYYGALVMFGHRDQEENGEGKQSSAEDEITPEMEMGQFIPFFQDLVNYINRAQAVIKNVVCQFACLYHARQKLYITTFKNVRLTPIFESLGSLCRVLVTFDAIIADNPSIGEGWHQFKRMIKYVRSDPQGYGVEEGNLRIFETLLLRLDKRVLNATIFEDAISQQFGLPGASSNQKLVGGNKVLFKEFTEALNTMYKKMNAGLGSEVETYPRTAIVELFALYALYRRIFAMTSKPDRRLFKALWEMQTKLPIVLLHGRAMWFPAKFLEDHAPLKTSGLNPGPSQVPKKRREYLRKLDEDFNRKTEEMYKHAILWMVRIEAKQTLAQSSGGRGMEALLAARGKLVINGLLLGNQIRNLLTTSVALHLALQVPILPKNVRSLAVLAELLKAIQATYHRSAKMIAENIAHLIGQTLFQIKRLLVPARQRIAGIPASKLKPEQHDVLAALNLALYSLDGTPTPSRRSVIEISLCVAQLRRALRTAAFDDLQYHLWKLDLLSSFQTRVVVACECSCLYWIANVIPVFFSDIFKNSDQVTRIPYLLAALRDARHLLLTYDNTPPSKLLETSKDGRLSARVPTERAKKFLSSFKAEVMSHFEDKILKPLCREVENDLRLHIHSVVLQQSSLRKVKFKDLRKFFEMRPLKFFDVMVDVKERVTHYLDTTFYNLTTVTLHDWRIYAEMRNLAYEEYGLKMAEVHLPGSSHYSEALDILEIMRNIHIFVARYNYNMNTQMFVEQATDQKHLNTISIKHIADSIRTHGSGIMNTTVDFTYRRFLGRKLMLFSEFLFDDHIRSRLLKDIKWFKNNGDKLKNKYPFPRAEKFNRAIRKLGVTKKGETYLDKFRRIITEIGNALGYVRTVRSAGMQYSSNAIKFVPDLDDIADFTELVEEQHLSPETGEACSNLDSVLKSLTDSFSRNTEYLKILVDVIKPALKKDRFRHLDNFHIIVPPLTFNFVEKMSIAKERISKKSGKGEASFTDDGFALGLAYLLKLLDQDTAFDSLHWFNAVKDFVNEKKFEIARQKKQRSKSSTQDLQHVSLTIKRLHNIRREFELLYYSFTGARIFFSEQESDAKENPQKDEEKEKGVEDEKGPPPDGSTGGAPNGVPPVGDVPPPPMAGDGIPPPPNMADIPPPPSAGMLPPPPM
ncbi:hypothetical protein AAMO2058_001524900 [Amorphochlora amoebiformis]|mmetsp:Transcript_28615/g.45590  ORF Transcript_28615/g.45590 Transcript_28615/m.45590 type:complete len:1257 (-) Transcript_28615:193-3963(-)